MKILEFLISMTNASTSTETTKSAAGGGRSAMASKRPSRAERRELAQREQSSR
ncbi:MAG: hypothetical protein IJA35_00695 [Clostridia bacterium]|nr:hypothetical protein [Clostridia bacterium]